MIRNELVNLSVLVAFALRMADQDNHLHMTLVFVSGIEKGKILTRGLPILSLQQTDL